MLCIKKYAVVLPHKANENLNWIWVSNRIAVNDNYSIFVIFFHCCNQNIYSKIMKPIFLESLYYNVILVCILYRLLFPILYLMFSVDVKSLCFCRKLLLCGLKLIFCLIL